MENYFRAQRKGYSFDQMKSYNSLNGGDGFEDEEKKGLCACSTVAELLRNTVMDAMNNDDEVIVFSAHKIEDIYDGCRVNPIEEKERFSVNFFINHSEEIAEKYEIW
jgi:hypothetical protein